MTTTSFIVWGKYVSYHLELHHCTNSHMLHDFVLNTSARHMQSLYTLNPGSAPTVCHKMFGRTSFYETYFSQDYSIKTRKLYSFSEIPVQLAIIRLAGVLPFYRHGACCTQEKFSFSSDCMIYLLAAVDLVYVRNNRGKWGSLSSLWTIGGLDTS